MRFPVLQKRWQVEANIAGASGAGNLQDHQETLLAIKDALVGFATLPWTVSQSSDSTAVDSSDLWDTYTDLVWAAAAPHSWIVLQHPVRPSQVMFDLDNAAPRKLHFYWSPSGGFSGGTISARPTASDEIDASDALLNWFANISSSFTSKIIALHSEDGTCTRIVGAQHASSKPALVMMLEQLTDRGEDWNAPSPGEAVFFASPGSTVADGAGSVATFYRPATAPGHIYHDGSAYTARIATVAYDNGTLGLLAEQTAGNTGNELGTGSPFALAPLWLVSDDVGVRGVLGGIVDAWAGPDSVAQGHTYPAASAERVLFQADQLVLPWTGDGTVPAIAASPADTTSAGHELGIYADASPPVVDNFSPPNGTEIEAADPLFFDVTDDSGLFRRVLVLVLQEGRWEAAYDGDSFLEPYDQSSEVTNIAGGFRFQLRRDIGWVGTVTVRIFAIDQSGNEA
jgi:hypothetical protein